MGIFSSIAAPLVGGVVSGLFSRSESKDRISAQEQANAQNAALQREFAQKGIQWKVADAKAAGLHPLSVLGSQTIAASPTYVAADPGNAKSTFGTAIGDALAALLVQKSEVDAFKEQVALEREQLDLLRMRQEHKIRELDIRGMHQNNWMSYDKHPLEVQNLKMQRRQGQGTREDPYPLFNYFEDPYTGDLFVAPHNEYAEGFDSAAGALTGAYGVSREHLRYKGE